MVTLGQGFLEAGEGGTHSGLTLILLYGLIPGHRHEMTDSHTLAPLSQVTKTVTRMPEFTSSSNMTVVYTYTGGTAHIDCGVNLQGNKFSDSYYWEEQVLFCIEDS